MEEFGCKPCLGLGFGVLWSRGWQPVLLSLRSGSIVAYEVYPRRDYC